jgi:hypothetical protein
MRERWLKIAAVVLVMLVLLTGPVAAAAAPGTPAAPDKPAAPGTPGGEIAWFNGPITHWPETWTPIPGLNDPQDGIAAEIDFAGSPASPGAYFAVDGQYVYFRVRVAVDAVAAPAFPLTSQDATAPAGWSGRTFHDRILLAIDNTADGRPDWGFAWDTARWPYYQGGLALLSRDQNGAASPAPGWSQLQQADRDEAAKVSPPDFRWDSTDGYVRTVDQQPTADFGPTTFVDFAVSWDFLARQRSMGNPLLPGQVWRIEFVSLAGEDGSTDVTGENAAEATGWGATIAVNAPSARVAPTPLPPTPVASTATPEPTATPARSAPRSAPGNAAPSATPMQAAAWQHERFVDFIDFRYPAGWTVTGRGDTSVLRGAYKGHEYVIDVYRPERPVGTSLEGWVDDELTRFRANLDTVTVRSLTFARMPAMRVGLLDLPDGDACPVVRIYTWSEDPPIPDIRQAMLTISQADGKACDTNSLNTFADMLTVMANK